MSVPAGGTPGCPHWGSLYPASSALFYRNRLFHCSWLELVPGLSGDSLYFTPWVFIRIPALVFPTVFGLAMAAMSTEIYDYACLTYLFMYGFNAISKVFPPTVSTVITALGGERLCIWRELEPIALSGGTATAKRATEERADRPGRRRRGEPDVDDIELEKLNSAGSDMH
ncbi:hypothetical protein BASA62_001313 [Batrachochytrium salamandrivorans]|nr:hypothetical protein BASA62_001313 [Batrachochytrium salamandrivorans]